MPSTAHRWRFFDPVTFDDVAIFLNPQELRLPDREKSITVNEATAPDGKIILAEGAHRKPATLGFVGVALTLDQATFLETWYDKEYQVRLTDDFAREWWIYIYKLTFTRPKTKPSHPELHRYTMDAYILDWPS